MTESGLWWSIVDVAEGQQAVNREEYTVPADAFHEVCYSEAGIQFSLWAPSADEVRLLLYMNGEDGLPCRREPLRKCAGGMWRAMFPPDLYGLFYAFQVRLAGRWLRPVPGLFAKAVGVNGRRGALVRHGEVYPEGWENDRPPYLAHVGDAVIYEMHMRDFSASTDSGMRHKGRYLALTEMDTCTPQRECSGLAHLQELGVTHVHLMPLADFASVDERVTDSPAYNWGYDPLNYNVPEGSYATDAYVPAVRLREFRSMVMALHKAGLRVVMDVVYNHTYTVDDSNFECQVPGYFYRRSADGTRWADGSGCGNETATEREGMRRFLVESVCYWAREFHIDGFRFDVMGLHDLETMRCVRDALTAIDPQILLYGEGWSMRPARLPEKQCAVKANMSALAGIAAFGDELRDGVRGWWTEKTEGGFLCGRKGYAESIKFGITGGVFHPQVDYARVNHSSGPWAASPVQMINYVSCHDDCCLADRLAAVAPQATTGERLRMFKLAETILFTSQGIPFLFAGDEMFRSKQGHCNSYNAGDVVNAIRWENKYIYKNLFRYIEGLIGLRKRYACFRLRTAEAVRRQIHFIPTRHEAVLAYRLYKTQNGPADGALYIMFNGLSKGTFVEIPHGRYLVLCRDGELCADGLGYLRGGRTRIPPCSALIAETLCE